MPRLNYLKSGAGSGASTDDEEITISFPREIYNPKINEAGLPHYSDDPNGPSNNLQQIYIDRMMQKKAIEDLIANNPDAGLMDESEEPDKEQSMEISPDLLQELYNQRRK